MMQFLRKNVRAIMLIVVVLFVVSCFAGFGGFGGGSGGGENGSGATLKDYAVATINGEKIMRSFLEQQVVMEIQNAGMTGDISEDELPRIREWKLGQLALRSEIDKEVVARKITVSKEEVNEMLKKIEGAFPTKELYLQEMQRLGMDDKKLRAEVEQDMHRMKLFDKVVEPASADESEIRTYYDVLKDFSFRKDEGFNINVAHFKKQETADAARGELNGGKNWDDVMASLSGDVADFTPYENKIFVPSASLINELAFILDAPMGTATAPVEIVSDDFMIVVKRDSQEAGVSTFDEVSGDIRDMVLEQKRQTLQNEFMQELHALAQKQIEILDPAIFPEPVPVTSGDATVLSEDQEAAQPEETISGDAATSGGQ